jgi:adenylylsulfate kinase
MKAADNNIFPVFGDLMQRHHKEAQLKQRARAFWLTGLSGSGKTTIAKGLEKELHRLGFFTQVLDGDNIRAGLNGNLGFSEEDRTENIRRIGEVSKLFVDAGIVTINCFVSPTRAIRAQARDIIGNDDFLEVFVNTPLEVCEQRDVKGLYVKARAGEIKNFTGIDAPFEAPEHPSINLKTADQSVDESVAELLNFVLEHIKYGD